MRVGRVPVVPYTRPGSSDVAIHIRDKASKHAAILLGNHGPVVAGSSLEAAVFALEEPEETAKLVLLTRGLPVRQLDRDQIRNLKTTFVR
jgi:3-dehydro-4-phosphotetronate decarboxylase